MCNFVDEKLTNAQLNRLKNILKITKICSDCLIIMFQLSTNIFRTDPQQLMTDPKHKIFKNF